MNTTGDPTAMTTTTVAFPTPAQDALAASDLPARLKDAAEAYFDALREKPRPDLVERAKALRVPLVRGETKARLAERITIAWVNEHPLDRELVTLQDAAQVEQEILHEVQRNTIEAVDTLYTKTLKDNNTVGADSAAGIAFAWARHRAVADGWHLVAAIIQQGATPTEAARRAAESKARTLLTRAKFIDNRSSNAVTNLIDDATHAGTAVFVDAVLDTAGFQVQVVADYTPEVS